MSTLRTDPYDGEVDYYVIEKKPVIRASNYSEWELKKQHEVLLQGKDRRLWSIIWNVGKKIHATNGICEEVFYFFKKAHTLKVRPEFKSKSLPINEKCVLAVFFTVAKKLGNFSLVERISSLPCNQLGTPCYVSRRKGDPTFKKYLKIALRYASVIYQNTPTNLIHLIDKLNIKELVNEDVYKKAKEIALKLQPYLSGRKPSIAVATCFKLALDEVMSNTSKNVLARICEKLKVSEISVRNFVNYLKSQNIKIS